MFWKAFKNERDEDFTDAVSEVIANNRAAPLFKEITEAIEKIRSGKSLYRSGALGSANPLRIIEEGARNNSIANKEYVKACLDLLKDRTTGRINKDQFEQGVDYLNEVAVQYQQKENPG